MISPLASTLAIPKYKAGKPYSGTTYLSTSTAYIISAPNIRSCINAAARWKGVDSTYHTPREPAGHERKAKEEDQPRLPRHARPTVAVAIRAQPRLLYAIDDKHSQGAAYPGYPVNKLDMDFAAGVQVGMRVGRGVDEEEEADGELGELSLVLNERRNHCRIMEARGDRPRRRRGRRLLSWCWGYSATAVFGSEKGGDLTSRKSW